MTIRHQFEGRRESGADSLGRVVVGQDLFRLGRHPAAVAYDPDRTAPPAGSPPASRPSLRLVGLVAGLHPVAVIEGLPGIEGARVVRAGEHVGELTVTAIEHARVRVAGPDTVWVLSLRKP